MHPPDLLTHEGLLFDLLRITSQVCSQQFNAILGNKRSNNFVAFLGFQSNYLHAVLASRPSGKVPFHSGPYGQYRTGQNVVGSPPKTDLKL